MTTVVLFLHELASNSMKYGALSVPAGSISLEWSCDRDSVHLVWREIDGPPVKEPATRGFGTEMLDRMVQSTVAASTVTGRSMDSLRERSS